MQNGKNRMKNAMLHALKGILEKTLRLEANSASCTFFYQPETPENLSEFCQKK